MRGMVRSLAVVTIFVAASACHMLQTTPGDQQTDTVIGPVCPEIIRSAAWVDRMPLIEEPSGNLHILLRTNHEGAWALSEMDRSEGGASRFALIESGGKPQTQIRYKEHLPGKMPEQIEIVCGGDVIATISDVEEVY